MLTLNKNNTLSDKKLRAFLFSLNFNIYSDGTKYLIDAIIIVSKQPSLLKNMKNIYSILSIKYSIPESSVKWAIRNSIDTMNRNTSDREINKKLSVAGYRKMTPKYFIPLVISHFKVS